MDRDAFAGRLLANERRVWTGRPRRGLMLSGRDTFLIPFSLLWFGFTLFWETSVLRTGAPTFMVLFGAVFMAIGLFLVIGRFFLDAWLRGRTVYAVTNRRVLVLRDGRWGCFQTVLLDRLPETTLVDQTGGRGTIRFGQQVSTQNTQPASLVPALDPTPQFLAIPDVRRVFALVQERAQAVGSC